MKNTTGTKMLIFSLAFAAMSYFVANAMDQDMVDLPLQEESTASEQVLTAEQMIAAATEEMREAISIFNAPQKTSWFSFSPSLKLPLELGKNYPVWCYLSALINLGEHGHLVEQLGKTLRLSNEDANKSIAFKWADDLAACGQPSVLYAFTDYLAECARRCPDLMDGAIKHSVVELALLGLVSVVYASRLMGATKTERREDAIKVLRDFYVSVLQKMGIVKSVESERIKAVRDIINRNLQYWNVDGAWLNALTVNNVGRPAFGKADAAHFDLTQSELMSEDHSGNGFEYELNQSISCVLQNLKSWLE